ncbi:unnamed protein product, partial [Ectocarpus sp. 8 AP-2014]
MSWSYPKPPAEPGIRRGHDFVGNVGRGERGGTAEGE